MWLIALAAQVFEAGPSPKVAFTVNFDVGPPSVFSTYNNTAKEDRVRRL
jgi:hypothetical protein